MSAVVNRALLKFAASRENARRFHADLIGKGVDTERSFGDWLLRVWRDDRDGLEKVYGSYRNVDGRDPVTKAALAESVGGATGGYLVPLELSYDLMHDVAEEALVRPRALVVPMGSATLDLSLPDATTVQAAGTSPFFGGILMQFKPEAATRPETEPAWRKVQLKARELTGYALASKPLLDDAGKPLEAVLRKLFARSIAWYEDYYFLQGNGVGQPMGMVNAPGAKAIARNAAAHFNSVDLGVMGKALLPGSWGRAVWAMSPSVRTELPALPNGLWQTNQPFRAEEGQPNFVVDGHPGFMTEKLPTLGTRGDVVLLDPTLYVIGDRQSIDIAVSRDEPTAWTKNQSVWRIVHRVDGQPMLAAPVTLQDGSTTASPYVVLN